MSRKIAVMGGSCSGKTTLARLAAQRLGVLHVALDALHHGPNWVEAPADELGAKDSASAEELRAKVDAPRGGVEAWVVDGNYIGKLGTSVVDQTDTIVFLDLPLAT